MMTDMMTDRMTDRMTDTSPSYKMLMTRPTNALLLFGPITLLHGLKCW